MFAAAARWSGDEGATDMGGRQVRLAFAVFVLLPVAGFFKTWAEQNPCVYAGISGISVLLKMKAP